MTPLESAARNIIRERYYRMGHQPSKPVDGYVDDEWREAIDDARAVLAAIRTPSTSMVQSTPEDGHVPIYPEDIWQAMIDAALEEGA